MDSNFPKDPSLPFHHVRRFVKESFLPESLRIAIEKEKSLLLGEHASSQQSEDSSPAVTIFVLIPPPLLELAPLRALLAPFVPSSHILNDASNEQASGNLGEHGKALESDTEPLFPVHRIKIPLQPPLNTQQAEQWSKTFWPTSFNAAFPRSMIAPPPKILSATKTNIAPKAGYYLALAYRVAQEAKRLRRGRGIGVVVVDPAIASAEAVVMETDGTDDDGVVAVAGDARFSAPGIVSHGTDGNTNMAGGRNPDCEGGPEFHAIMRAVEMIAGKRRGDGSFSATASTDSAALTTDTVPNTHCPPLTTLESHYLHRPPSSSQNITLSSPADNTSTMDVTTADADLSADDMAKSSTSRILPRTAGGYLCTDLDIYITHEPCLACSMGMLLSRFRAITFPRQGRLASGGLASMSISSSSPQLMEQEKTNTESIDDRGNETNDTYGDDSKAIETNINQARSTYYGLHWRKELNWRAMCFEFITDNAHEAILEQPDIEVTGDYHA